MYRKRLFSVVGVLLVAAALGGCLIYPTPTPQADLEAEFVEAVWAFENACQTGDIDQIMEWYAEDAVSLPPGFPPVEGRDGIEASLQFLAGHAVDRDFELIDYTLRGDYGTRLGVWTMTLTPEDGGDPIVEQGRCIVGFKKIDGEWKVIWEIWNNYEF
jgi:ketosteroid isomerase-like protein